jgi:hypothetical protein
LPDTNISECVISGSTKGGALGLPIRSDKTVFSFPAAVADANTQLTAARPSLYTDYALIRIYGRNPTTPGTYSASDTATYHFLINPSDVQIARTTGDSQAFTRSGTVNGVRGEDPFVVSVSGKTPGKYYDFGTTDYYTEYSLSYRNLLALELLVENNGCWFEGEGINQGTTARQIKMHGVMELVIGDFIWEGLFDSFQIAEDASSPFLVSYSLEFLVLRERFRSVSPYPNSIDGARYFGHYAQPQASSSASPSTTATRTANSTYAAAIAGVAATGVL